MYRLIGAGAVAIAFAIALWQILHNLPHKGGALPGDLPVAPAVADSGEKPGDHPAEAPKADVKPPDNPKPEPKAETPKPEPKPEQPKQPIDQPRDRNPSPDRVHAGTLVSKDAVVLTRGARQWMRVAPDAVVVTAAPLLALPGYHAEIRSDSGAKLFLWGNLPDWLPGGFLDCQVTLHAPPPGFDLDLTLERGRIYLVGAKKPTPIRLRFAGEIWDLTLADDTTEIVVDVVSAFAGESFVRDGKGESPLVQAQLGVLSGQVTAQIESRRLDLRAAPATCGLVWENKKAGLTTLELMSPLPTWAKQPLRPLTRERQQDIDAALKNLMTRIATPNKPVDLAIAEVADAGTPVGKSLAVLAAGALEAWQPVLDALEDGQSPELRQAAALALQELIARRPEFDTHVYEQLQAKLGYLERQADETMALLHGVSEAGRTDPATYDLLFSRLRAERIGERELAAWRLAQLDPEGAVRARYRAGDTEVQRDRAIAEWRKRIPEGKVPPGRL
jgi:hypothetical protein